jgi:transposase InsO family protein
VLENIALRQQLAVLSRQSRRPRLRATDRLFWSWLSRLWSDWRRTLVIVQPETVIRRLARENPRWGSVRIRGELGKLGFQISAESVRCYRRSALRRPPSQSWRTFLKNHAPHIWAADFFTLPTVTFHTRYVFFFITHDRRRIVHLNVTAHPTAEWVWRQLIAATPWGEQPRYLIRDRDLCYGGAFIPRAARIGIRTLLTPVQAPKANAIAERVVGTLRRECLDHMIIANEQHLRMVLREYAAHYNRGRPHRSLGLETPTGPPARAEPPETGRIVARPVLGGLHHEYEWVAA